MIQNEIEQLFRHFNGLTWKNDIPVWQTFEIAKQEFEKLEKECTYSRKFYRLVGQSGSGKTTQLLPATTKLVESIDERPIHFCVRRFSTLHPQYAKLANQCGSEIRERTNGFALQCLLVCLKMAIEGGCDIILEMTFLTREFEEYLLHWLDEKQYKKTFLCLAVNIDVSNSFIQKRMHDKDSAESGRVVQASSTQFFFKQMKEGIGLIKEKCAGDRIIIWNAFDKECKYDGKVRNCLNVFEREQQQVKKPMVSKEELLNAKIEYLIHSNGN